MGNGYLTGPAAARGVPPLAGPNRLAAQAAFVQPGPVNAWDPYMALCLGLNPSPPCACSPYVEGLPVSPAPPQPGTLMTGAVAMFTPMPAIPGTGPGISKKLYQAAWGVGPGGNQVNWSGRTPRALGG